MKVSTDYAEGFMDAIRGICAIITITLKNHIVTDEMTPGQKIESGAANEALEFVLDGATRMLDVLGAQYAVEDPDQ